MKKSTKTYNLALKATQPHPALLKPPQPPAILQIITQIPQNKSSENITPHPCTPSTRFANSPVPPNIFQQQSYQRHNFVSTACDTGSAKGYDVLCSKEVEAYRAKLNRIKCIGIAGVLRLKVSESFLSSCRHTGTFGDLHLSGIGNTGVVTREEIGDFYGRVKQTMTNKDQQGEQLNRANSERHTTKVDLDTIRYGNSSSIINKKHQKYQTAWQVLNNKTSRTQTQKSYLNLTCNPTLNLTQSPQLPCLSSCRPLHCPTNSLHSHRKKLQNLQLLSLKQQRENIPPTEWVHNLRKKQGLKEYGKDKYVQSIWRDNAGVKLKGSSKIEKEYNWINRPEFRGCNLFQVIDQPQVGGSGGRVEFIKGRGKNMQEQRAQDSKPANQITEIINGNSKITGFNVQ